MKESIGSSQLFIIVVTVILIFTAIMTYTMKRANAFAMKDKIINVIEKHDDFDQNALDEIVDIFTENGYRQNGSCPSSATGYTRIGVETTQNNAAFCVERTSFSSTTNFGAVQKYYYKITVFYGLTLPIANDNFNFTMTSKTKGVKGDGSSKL